MIKIEAVHLHDDGAFGYVDYIFDDILSYDYKTVEEINDTIEKTIDNSPEFEDVGKFGDKILINVYDSNDKFIIAGTFENNHLRWTRKELDLDII